jgi:hypothetical protein
MIDVDLFGVDFHIFLLWYPLNSIYGVLITGIKILFKLTSKNI